MALSIHVIFSHLKSFRLEKGRPIFNLINDTLNFLILISGIWYAFQNFNDKLKNKLKARNLNHLSHISDEIMQRLSSNIILAKENSQLCDASIRNNKQ